MTIDPATKKLIFPLFGLYMGQDYLKEVNEDLDLTALLDRPVPKLFAFGTGDTHTLLFQRELGSIREQTQNLSILEIPGANHIFNRVTWSTQLIEGTIDWVLNVCS